VNLKKKWIETFYNIATGSRKIRNFFTPIGAFFYALLIISFVIIAVNIDRSIGLISIFPNPLNIILSLPVFSLALFLI